MLEMIRGDPLAPIDIEAKLRGRLTLLDTPGLVGLALAGIDMAAWDAGIAWNEDAVARHAT
jgi:mandelate racemase